MAVGAAVLAAGAVGAGLAVGASTVVTDTNNVRLRIVQSEFTTGFDSQWHTHPGLAIVQVQAGSFRITQGSCRAREVEAGDTLVEVPLVPVRAVAQGYIKWTTTFVLPQGQEPTTLVASPCTSFADWPNQQDNGPNGAGD
jgi:quercetin dioxygenase-like cupin family protein